MIEGWVTDTLSNLCNVEYGTRVVRKRDAGSIYPVYGGGGATFSMDIFNRENRMIIGRFAMSKKCTRFVKGKFFLNDSGLTLSTKKNNLMDDKFLNYQILSLNDAIYSMGRGTAQKNLNVDDFKKLSLSFPNSLEEQKEIVSILDDAFASIDKAKANIERNIENANELFQSKLNAVFSQTGEGWKEKKMGDIYEFKNGVNFNKNDKNGKGVLTIGVLDMYRGGLMPDLSNLNRVDKQFHEDYMLKHGDILIVRSSVKREGVAWATYFDSFDEKITYGGFIIRGRANQVINPKYVVYFLRSQKVRTELIEKSVKSTITNINQQILSNIQISISPLAKQKEIVGILDKLNNLTQSSISNYKKELDNLEELKKSILQKAFSGELTNKSVAA